MEEILKNIENEVNLIKEKQEELNILTNNSKEIQDEFKKLQQEKDSILDRESGFYKDIQEKVTEKESEFRQADIKRMTKDREINKLVLVKKESIIKQLEEKKKYIDENRNLDLQGKDIKSLKEEKEKLEKEIKLNDTTKEEFMKMSDSEKQEVRKAKENYLNNKHRLNEINPTIELMDFLDGKEPKDRFMEIEGLIKIVECKFNRDNLDEVLNDIEKDKTQEQTEEENWYDPKGFEEALENAQEIKAEREKQEAKNAQMSREEFAKFYNPNYKMPEQREQQENQQIEEKKNKIVLSISEDKINVNGNESLFYKEEFKNRENIVKEYGIESIFLNDKKAKRNLDYALISTLEKIDKSLVEEYFKVIKDGKTQSKEVKESIEKLNNAVDIIYKFDKNSGILTNLKEKRIARNAKKLGVASLEGISEKSIFDKIKDSFSKIKNTKLLKGKEEHKALGSGEKTNAQIQKAKTIELIEQDRRIPTLKDRVKVDNKNTQNIREQQSYERYCKNIDDVQKNFRKQRERFANGAEWKDGNIVPKEIKDEKEEETPEI